MTVHRVATKRDKSEPPKISFSFILSSVIQCDIHIVTCVITYKARAFVVFRQGVFARFENRTVNHWVLYIIFR